MVSTRLCKGLALYSGVTSILPLCSYVHAMDDSVDDTDLGPDSHIDQDDNDMLFFEADESVETDPCLDLEQDRRAPPVFITIHR
ncbi:hypothetical protein CDV36_002217 [Fusarium kuroshium]|uniref:Uncharacterized protein n=2 Tax=Fusarium solani species complex TaxID=232080 RepID=A0A3M2SKR6_9HYPO|nr:hypothetical protein CDV36_002217 [Fusarium kuroshium]RSM00049.1 hypothetical protein CEP52_009392 [Fusarium oligoseptatum]